jgi:hypothetical protein
LRDEYKHVEFQTEQLALIRLNRSAARLRITRALQRIRFAGTVMSLDGRIAVLSRAGIHNAHLLVRIHA